MKTTHRAVKGSERRALPGAIATGKANPHSVVEVTLKLRRKATLPELKGRPDAVTTRKQLAERYGASKTDIDATTRAFERFGLSPIEENAATRTVRLRGTVSQMEQAFQVKLFNYKHPSGNYRGRVGAVHVPSELKDIVVGVFGLDSRRTVRRRRQPVSESGPSGHSIPSSWYIPSELAAHYNFPRGDGSGQTIGLLEFGGGYFPNDLKKFCSLAKISSPPKVSAVSVDGTATDSRDGAEGEVMLDIEVAGGVCPRAKIVVYFAQFTEQGWITILDTAVHDSTNDPGVLSVSWGFAEDQDVWTTQAMTQVNETLQEAAALGITVCVASGDDGSSDAVSDGLAHVDFPSSSPFVLSVGGTTIPSKGSTQADVVWFEGDGLRADQGGSTGGGVSAVFACPQWQQGVAVTSVNPGAITGRCIPDISANADWNASPYLLVVDGKSQPNGGTSAATPLVAGLLTLINAGRAAGHRVGYVTPVLYQPVNGGDSVGSAGCTDVVSGNNTTDSSGGYAAGPSYDAASGWGTPNGANLAQALKTAIP